MLTKQEFEDALKGALITVAKGNRSCAKLKYLGVSGWLANEHVYAVWPVGTSRRIVARGGPTGYVLWIEYFHKKAGSWFSLDGTPVIRATPNRHWQRRMTNGLRRLWNMALADSKYQPTETEEAEAEAYDDHQLSRQPTPSLQPTRR